MRITDVIAVISTVKPELLESTEAFNDGQDTVTIAEFQAICDIYLVLKYTLDVLNKAGSDDTSMYRDSTPDAQHQFLGFFPRLMADVKHSTSLLRTRFASATQTVTDVFSKTAAIGDDLKSKLSLLASSPQMYPTYVMAVAGIVFTPELDAVDVLHKNHVSKQLTSLKSIRSLLRSRNGGEYSTKFMPLKKATRTEIFFPQ